MRNKSSVPRATNTVASSSRQAASQAPKSARTSGKAKSKANSTVRQSNLEPYHDIAASVFTINDTAELEAMFLAAARDGDFAQVEALLRRRNDLAYSIDIRDTETGNTAIIWAAKRGHYKIVELLLQHGADVTLRNYDGQTAIEVSSAIIGNLLLKSANCGGPHRNLLQAAWQGDSVLVQKILSENRVDINCRNSDGLTPLLLVTRDVQLFERIGDKITKPYNPVDVVTELLAHSADPNVEDEDGKSPLHYISSSKAPVCGKLTKILLDKGADIEKRDRRCFTPIHCAAQSGNVEVVVALLAAGSEANSRGFAGTTPLHISAINGNALVISKLLSYGADVRLVDDSGLTCVDVAKTKVVKAALKEAWSEVTQAKASDLGPVKTPSGEALRRSSHSNSVTMINQNRARKTSGEVIFDALTGPTAESITPRRASTIASIERHLSLADKTKRSEEQLHKELASASISNRGRTPSSCARSPTAGRKLTPIKAHSQPWRSRRDVKFGPGTKHHDGLSNTHPATKKSSSDLMKANAESIPLPVTVLGLELDDNLHENRGNRLPTGRLISNRLAQQHHQYAATNIADVSNLVDELYLQGRSSSKASTLIISDDFDDQTPFPTSRSPPRLTPIRTPSASDRNRGLRIPTTINEDHTHLSNAPLTSMKNNITLHALPNQRKVLPTCTPTCLPHHRADMRLVDCSQDFSSKDDSPRMVTNTMKDGDFNIEETRIRNSDDSGIPEDKNSSKSGSVSSSVSNLSSSSPLLPEPDDKVTPRGHHNHTNPGNDSKVVSDVMRKSRSDSSLRRQTDVDKGDLKTVDSVKLKQVAKDNALLTQHKVTSKADPVTSNVTAQGRTVNTTSAERDSSKRYGGHSSKENSQPGAKQSGCSNQSSASEANSQGNKSNHIADKKSGMSQQHVLPNVKSSQSSAKAGNIMSTGSQDSARNNSQGVTKQWNSSTNLKSINTRSSASGNSSADGRPLVPARPSASAQASASAKEETSHACAVSKVIVEDLETDQLCSGDQKRDDDVMCDSASAGQGPKPHSDKTTNNHSVNLKAVSENAAGSGTAAKAKPTVNNVATSKLSDKSVNRTKKADASTCKPKQTSPSSVCTGRQTNTKSQTSQASANKTNPPKVVSKQNVPKNSDTTPVRPPRKSQIQKASSTGISSLSKQVGTNSHNDKEKASKECASMNDSSAGSQPAQSASVSSKVVGDGMKVEEVDVPADAFHSSRTKTDTPHGGGTDEACKSSLHDECTSSDPNRRPSDSSSTENPSAQCVNAGRASGERSTMSNVKLIQVMPTEEQAAPSQHDGPVIVDIFESLRQERELAEQRQNEDAKLRDKTGLKLKQPLYPKKTKTPDVRVISAGGKTKRPLKSASSDKNERPRRQQNRKAKKKKTKKMDKEDAMMTDRPEKKETPDTGSAYASGKGWCVSAEHGGDTSVHQHDASDDSDDDMTWVQPNYISDDASGDEDDILTTSLRRNDDSLRHSFDRKFLPGQIHHDDSEDGLSQDAEDVQFSVVFTIGSLSDESPGTTSRDILDITEEAMSGKEGHRLTQTKERPALQTVTVKGTSDVARTPQQHGIMPQVSEVIAAFSRQVSGLELDEMLEGDVDGRISESKQAEVETEREQRDSKAETSCDRSKEAVSSASAENKFEKDVSENELDKNHNNKAESDKCHPTTSSEQTKSAASVKNTVIRHKEGFKAPKVQQKASDDTKTEDKEISEMINEILKSTPDPSLNLSWKSRSEQSSVSRKSIGSTKGSLLRHSLDDKQNCSFREIPNVMTKELPGFDASAPRNEDEEIQMTQKLMNTYRNMPLQVEGDECGGQIRDQASVPKGKPPVPPKPLNTITSQPMKSPRFVRKHDSIKGKQAKVAAFKDTDSLAATSEFDTMSLPFNDQDTLIPSDRAETVTSRLGRHNSASRPSSSMTNTSEDVETIQWKRGNLLGKGAFGKVWCGLTNAGELIAVKQIELNIDNMEKAEKEYEKIQEEVGLLKTLNHQNIVGYLGTSLEDNIVSIFMQFVPGGSIYNLISRFGALEEEVFCRYTQQILQGVQYLHSNNVIHRDIKGGNIMLMPNGVIKLIDFGCAKRLYLNVTPSLNGSNKEQLLKSMRGTPYWMAPEVVREEGHGTKSDIWSIGCTVFEMATMKPPWANVPSYAAIFTIGNDEKPVPELPDTFSLDARRFVSACLTRDQKKRPSAVELLSHPFILKRMRKPSSLS